MRSIASFREGIKVEKIRWLEISILSPDLEDFNYFWMFLKWMNNGTSLTTPNLHSSYIFLLWWLPSVPTSWQWRSFEELLSDGCWKIIKRIYDCLENIADGKICAVIGSVNMRRTKQESYSLFRKQWMKSQQQHWKNLKKLFISFSKRW